MANTRTVALFTMHARVKDNVIDYEKFFQWISSLPRMATRVQVRDDLVFVIDRIQPKNKVFELTFVSGDPSDIPLFFNEGTGEVEEGSTDQEVWPARQTGVLVDTESRLVSIESRRAGVGSVNLEKYFRNLARDQGYASNLHFDLTMQPGASFEEELEQYERIREASITIRRPNTDWEDAEAELSDLADASGGHSASITVNAGRGESLSKSEGLVSAIRSEVKRPQTSVENARVIGTKAGEQRETTLSLSRHQVRKPIKIPRGASPTEEREHVFSEALSLIMKTASNMLGVKSSVNAPQEMQNAIETSEG